jgi:endonuclease/exonuclease/phosphatase family metal-dependent hydrolase
MALMSQWREQFLKKEKADADVVVGDFNDVPSSASVRLFAASAPYKNVFEDAAFTTWKTRPSGEVKRTIDFAFVSAGLDVVSRMDPTAGVDFGIGGLPTCGFPSDHLPLRFEVGWRR